MTKNKIYMLLVFIVLFSVLNVASAQEVGVVDTQDNGVLGINREVFVGVCVALAIFVQGVFFSYNNKNFEALLQSYNKLLDDKSVRNAAEHAYMSSSLPVQEFIKILKSGILVLDQLDVVDSIVEPLVDFTEDITDGDGLD